MRPGRLPRPVGGTVEFLQVERAFSPGFPFLWANPGALPRAGLSRPFGADGGAGGGGPRISWISRVA